MVFFLLFFVILIVLISCNSKNSTSWCSSSTLWWFFVFFFLFFLFFTLIAFCCYHEEEKKKSKESKCKTELDRRRLCQYNSIFEEDHPNKVKVAFWSSSVVDTETREIPLDHPDAIEEFSWNDPKRCYTWNRTVSQAQGGGTRLNVASDFELIKEKDKYGRCVYIFSFTQNESRCCSEFKSAGTRKTFRSDLVTVDESTGQQGSPLWAAVVEAEGIIEITDGNNVKIIKI